MTALALLQLHDAGQLNLDAPVRRYLPWFAIQSLGGPILVHQLLSHTAGLPDDLRRSPATLPYPRAKQRQNALRSGNLWSYSNDGYATAGAILAQLDGRFWDDVADGARLRRRSA